MPHSDRKQWSTSTKLNHPEKVELPKGNAPVLSPIFQSVKFVLSDETPYFSQYVYSRVSNPTLRQLEMTLAEAQKKEDCIVLASGNAAITATLLGLLKCGDHLISFRELYRPARIFIRETLPRFGIETSLLKLSDLDTLERSIQPGKTKLIHFESPSNPNLEIADISKIIAIARKYNVLISMDGTFGGIHQHTTFDIDLMIQSLTKFGNGHGDVLAGSVAGRADLIAKIREMSFSFGASLDPHAAFLVQRGLKTYMLRYSRQTKNAEKIAEYLNDHPKVSKVFYPGLKGHPGDELAKRQMKDMGGVISFILNTDSSLSADKFCHKLQLIQLAVSLGSTETLICPTLTFFGDDLRESDCQEMGISEFSLRLSIGLEDPEDLIEDLSQAFERGR